MIKSKRMRWAGHVARMGETRNTYRILVGNLEEKRPLGALVNTVDELSGSLKLLGIS
jgi:hypothetical protein